MPARYGLIGYPLTHSFSPAYFGDKFARGKTDAIYEKYELTDIAGFPSLLASHPDLKGLNVTIPYKSAVIPFLDELSDAARQIGAVNCIQIRDGKLKGHNTDVIGFGKSLAPLLGPYHRLALVLGTGGSSHAVQYVLQDLDIPFTLVSRSAHTGQFTYDDLNEAIISEHLLIINTTPLGMYPNIISCPPIPYAAVTEQHLLYDLIYNPEETAFLKKGREQGAMVKNGLEMLHLQAEASWEIWNS
jgi:shikimate dehydrogenase